MAVVTMRVAMPPNGSDERSAKGNDNRGERNRGDRSRDERSRDGRKM